MCLTPKRKIIIHALKHIKNQGLIPEGKYRKATVTPSLLLWSLNRAFFSGETVWHDGLFLGGVDHEE
jgi:hypothetical protein